MKHLVSSIAHLNVLCLMVLLCPSAGNAQDGGTWTAAGTLSAARANHTATPLANGMVLVAGGVGTGNALLASAEIYDPGTNGWTTVASMITARETHSATLLADGRVLVAGGYDPAQPGGARALAEIYDPSTGQWTATGTLNRARYAHTATLLPNGMVLVAGGCCDVNGYQQSLKSSELWDPATGQWTITGDLGTAHAYHTATVLSDGTVLVAGGSFMSTAATAAAELYHPDTGSWTAVGSLTTARMLHTASLLNGNRVLLAGGSTGGCCSGTTAAELYDPVTQTWGAVPPMSMPRREHSAAVIQGGAAAVIAGGYTCCNVDPTPIGVSAEIFDLASQTWSLTGSMSQSRSDFAMTTLGDGTAVAVGGQAFGSSQRDPVASAERFHPAGAASQTTQVTISSNVPGATFTATGTNCNSGTFATPATLTWTVGASCTLTIPVPDGYVFSGWSDGSQANPRSVTAPATTTTYSFVLTTNGQNGGTWSAAGTLSAARMNHTATPLGDGTVLVAGGKGAGNVLLASAEIYDPGPNAWTTAGSMISARDLHTATLLVDGRVLVVGGTDGSGNGSALAEIYDPSTGQWTATGTLNRARYAHTASLLPSGLVLIAGGCCDVDGQSSLTSSELWDPATEQWTITGDLGTAHAYHTATVLSDGTVLVAGGSFMSTAATAAAELYDPDTESWTAVGNLTTARMLHTASLLNGDRVLLAGGSAGGCCSGITAAELYDPASETWHAVQSMSMPRREHSAAVIKGGASAVIAGGYTCCNVDPTPIGISAEIFDLVSQTWSPTGSMSQSRSDLTMTTLGDGTAVAVGGQAVGSGQQDPVASAERFLPAGAGP